MNTLKKFMMNPLNLVVAALLIVGCATAPKSLVEARSSYETAQASTAPQYAPTELKQASEALKAAEEAYDKLGGDDEATQTLSYIATRKSETAIVAANTFAAEQKKTAKEKQLLAGNKDARESLAARLDANKDLAAMTSRQLQAERAKLREAQEKLDDSEMNKEELAAERVRIAELTTKLDAEREARNKLEEDLARTRAELEKVASIKEEPNKLVITLNGSILFETGKSDVRAGATHRLDQVSEVLVAEGDASITVMGYTDSQGTESNNQTLSENRATSVRTYLVRQGIAQDRISSKGLGESNPVASNDTETGRALNRRVEIIVNRATKTSSL